MSKNGKPGNGKPGNGKPGNGKPGNSNTGNGKGSSSNVSSSGQTAQPKHGVKAQGRASNNYQTTLNIRNFADNQAKNGGKVGLQSIAAAYGGGLTAEQQRYLYDYAGNKGYQMGDGFRDQYKDAAAFNATPDLQRAYNTGSFRGAMVDGGITKKEIQNRVKLKAQEKGEGFNKQNAFLRIADKWSGKGGMMHMGALNKFRDLYQKNNQLDAMFSGSKDPMIQATMGNRSQSNFYDNILKIKSDKNFMKGHVFGRNQNGELSGSARVADTSYLGRIAGNPGLNSIPTGVDNQGSGTGDDTGTGGGGADTGTEPLPTEKEDKQSIEGGIGSTGYANALGIRGRRSSWKSSGKSTGGTSNFNFNRVLANGYFGSR